MKFNDFERTIRRTLDDFSDFQEGDKFDQAHIVVALRWAIDQISHHTAVATATAIPTESGTTKYPLPSNLLSSVSEEGVVSYRPREEHEYQFMEPTKRIPGVRQKLYRSDVRTRNFMEWPQGHITLTFDPTDTGILDIYYFAYWDSPDDIYYSVASTGLIDGEEADLYKWYDRITDEEVDIDQFEIKVPRQLEQSLVYFTCASVLDNISVQTADLGRWKRKQESGHPEHNPIMKQAEYFTQRARELMYQIPFQDRATFYKKGLGI